MLFFKSLIRHHPGSVPRSKVKVRTFSSGSFRLSGINTLVNIMSRFGKNEESESKITHNERLEFLGDAVIEFLTSIHLFHLFPTLEEGGLATYRQVKPYHRLVWCVSFYARWCNTWLGRPPSFKLFISTELWIRVPRKPVGPFLMRPGCWSAVNSSTFSFD